MYKLHYAHKDLEDNIPTFNFKHLITLTKYLIEMILKLFIYLLMMLKLKDRKK
jgi:hypothetical protein